MISINYRDGKPIFEQVKDGFRAQIIAGILHDGDKMPSVRELATELAINPNTIQRAYRELESEGYICSVPGKGSFVSRADSALVQRRAELTGSLRTILRELRQAGGSVEELEKIIREEFGND